MEVEPCNNNKYLKVFNNHSKYESYLFGNYFLVPNVSYCVEQDEVHYGLPKDKLYVVYEVEDTVNPTVLFRGENPEILLEDGFEDDFLLDGQNMKLSELTRE